MSRVSSANFSQRVSSFNSQSATVIAESFFDEIEWHLFRDAEHLLGEAVKYVHEGISVNRRLTALSLQSTCKETKVKISPRHLS